MNWPTHRGTATAFPMAGFGLSAFFFSAVSSLAFPEDTSDLLLLLALGTFGMVFLSCFFLRIVDHPQNYATLPIDEGSPHGESRQLRPAKSFDRLSDVGRDSNELASNGGEDIQHWLDSQELAPESHGQVYDQSNLSKQNIDESTSVVSDLPPSDFSHEHSRSHVDESRTHHPDVRGLALLPKMEFWHLFSLLGILAGIGLMTIKYVTPLSKWPRSCC